VEDHVLGQRLLEDRMERLDRRANDRRTVDGSKEGRAVMRDCVFRAVANNGNLEAQPHEAIGKIANMAGAVGTEGSIQNENHRDVLPRSSQSISQSGLSGASCPQKDFSFNRSVEPAGTVFEVSNLDLRRLQVN
jgi:hypothetical protein